MASIGDVLCQFGFEAGAHERRRAALLAAGGATSDPDTDPQHAAAHAAPWRYSWRRTLEMGIIRGVVLGPFLVYYFPFLSRLVPGTSWRAVLGRVAADQAIGAPVSITLVFVAAALLQGAPETALPRLQQQLVPTWQLGASYWPIVHTLNFRFVPLPHQPFVAHAASLWWNAVLSYEANLELKPVVSGGDGSSLGVSGSVSDSAPAATPAASQPPPSPPPRLS